MTAQTANQDTAYTHGWAATLEPDFDGTIIRFTRGTETVRVRYTTAGNVAAAFYNDRRNHVSRHLGTRTPNKRAEVTAWLTNALSDDALDDGTRVTFTRSHIHADGTTTKRTHTGTIVGTDGAHATATVPQRAYRVIVDDMRDDIVFTFLANDITAVDAPSVDAAAVPAVIPSDHTECIPCIDCEAVQTYADDGRCDRCRNIRAAQSRAIGATLAEHATGYTIGRDGRIPTRGAAVGVAESLVLESVDANAIAAFAGLHTEYDHFGIWQDTDTNLFHVDAVLILSRNAAMAIARIRGEIAIWDFATNAEIRVSEE